MMRVKPKFKSQGTRGSRGVGYVPEKAAGQVGSARKKVHLGSEHQITEYRGGEATWAQIMHPVFWAPKKEPQVGCLPC